MRIRIGRRSEYGTFHGTVKGKKLNVTKVLSGVSALVRKVNIPVDIGETVCG
jgi:hypothetical protein